MLLYALFGLFVALSVADAITTYRALRRPGTREANPVMRWLFDRLGIVPALVATKAAAVAAVWATMGVYSVWVLAGVNAAYAFVVWRNHYTVGR